MNQNIKKAAKTKILNRLLRYERPIDYPYRDYFENNKCIFIHISKTAGTSILSKISEGQYYRDHCTYREYISADSNRFRRYFKFTFVRHPLDRLVSIYRYLSNGGNQMDDLYFKNFMKQPKNSFDNFVNEFLTPRLIHSHRLFYPQNLYIFDHKEELMVDFVGRFESIQADFDYISKKLNIDNNLEKTNITNISKETYHAFYKREDTLQKAIMLYKDDFRLLNYSTTKKAQS